MNPIDFHRNILPGCVEYRRAMHGGVEVVQIFLQTLTPRVLVYFERSIHDRVPLSVFLDEIISFCTDAEQCSRREVPPREKK